MLAGVWNALRREPLVHFAALAALLFMTYDVLQPSEQEALVIDRASLEQLMNEQATLLGRPLTDEERTVVVERAIDDAVLLREVYKRGLDQDAVVERHLVQKMRFVLGEEVPEPSDAELKAYLAANRDRYRGPPTVTLDHVFYADPGGVPDKLLAQLQTGLPIGGLGDSLSLLGDAPARYTLRDLMGLVGPEVAQRVFEAPIGEWRGPCGRSAACISSASRSSISRACRASGSSRAICARTGSWTSSGARPPPGSLSCAKTTASWSSPLPELGKELPRRLTQSPIEGRDASTTFLA